MTAKTVIAFDFGMKSIGMAVGQSITGTANTLPPLKARDGVPDWKLLEQLLAEWRPQQLVVGLPLNMDGSESELSKRAAKFSRQLEGRLGLPTETMDERLSSFEARGEILRNKRSQDFKQHNVDGLAARLILESWFAQQA